MTGKLREQALSIWHAAVAAVKPAELIQRHLQSGTVLRSAVESARRVLVVGAGKAGAAMSAAVESCLLDQLIKVEGIVNVPADCVRPMRKIRLHGARPAGSNHPTAAGVAGAEEMLSLLESAQPDDIALCLLSGGGSALLPAPVEGISLADKQTVTKLLHACGATIHEMNVVRKHLSRIKGGRLAQAFRGRQLHSIIISDVVGDPLDVIASGPTAADASTFADAINVLEKFQLGERVPDSIWRFLREGQAGRAAETLKALPAHVHNHVIGNNRLALDAARLRAEEIGFRVLDLGAFVEGETAQVATAVAGIVRSIRADRQPLAPPCCTLIGGETTVTLGEFSGKGGRNQEFVLAMLQQLGVEGMNDTVVLSGGTDGEDGPTDAAGAVADQAVLKAAAQKRMSTSDSLSRHDAYPFFDATGALIRTGLTETNVMDVRVILLG